MLCWWGDRIVDFTDVRAVQLDKVTQELIADTHGLAAKIHGYRPLAAEIVKAVQNRLLGEQVYNSNAIEGSTLTLRETVGILEVGAVLNVRKKREAEEVLGLLAAEGRLLRKRWDNHLRTDVYDDRVDPIQVAQQFLQEVLLSRLS